MVVGSVVPKIRSFRRQLVGCTVCHNLPKGREVTLPCSYRSTCFFQTRMTERKKRLRNSLFNLVQGVPNFLSDLLLYLTQADRARNGGHLPALNPLFVPICIILKLRLFQQKNNTYVCEIGRILCAYIRIYADNMRPFLTHIYATVYNSSYLCNLQV